MKSQHWILAFLVVSCLGCVTKAAYQEKADELQNAKKQLRQVSELAQKYGGQVADMESKQSELLQQNTLLRNNNQEATRRIDDLMNQLADMDSSQIPNVDTVRENGAFTYRVDDSILFEPGKAVLKATGTKTLGQLSELLQTHDFKIEIAGHTDSDPVQKTKKMFPRGNIELGAERALSVWSALAQAGVGTNRMRVSSYGEYKPIDPADKGKNRRVEIRVLLAEQQESP